MAQVSSIPRDARFDSTIALLSEGYDFIPARCRRFGTDLFRARLLMRPVVCTSGSEAAQEFYHPGRFTRRGAMPLTTLLLLQDKGSVQTLDGEEHRWRKEMFIGLMTPRAIAELTDRFTNAWREAATAWQDADRVVLLDAAQEVLCRAVWEWCGLPPLSDEQLRRRTREIGAMVGAAGAFGPRNWRALLLRHRTEKVVGDILARMQAGDLPVEEGSPAAVIAGHRTLTGDPITPGIAAVELINILRPVVAVAYYIVFIALALHRHPEWRDRITAGAPEDLENFVQEVRRLYPFFPFVGGRVRRPFAWRGHDFSEGDWVLFDLYGTNHHPDTWARPDAFDPDRFQRWNGSPFNFIPQGGGGHRTGHRCPGEWITIDLMRRSAQLLATAMRYDVPAQDLTVSLSDMPARPADGFVMSNVSHAG